MSAELVKTKANPDKTKPRRILLFINEIRRANMDNLTAHPAGFNKKMSKAGEFFDGFLSEFV